MLSPSRAELVVVSVRARPHRAPRVASASMSLNAIERELERARRALEAIDDDLEDSDADDVDERDGGVIVGNVELERVAPLALRLLPETNGYRGRNVRFTGKRAKGNSAQDVTDEVLANAASGELKERLAKRAARPRCERCGLDFTSDAQYAEHCKGKKHANAVRTSVGGSADRRSSRARAVKAPLGAHCALCRKIFTSDAQKAEHEGGKWHRQRVEGKLAPSNKPYA